MYFYIQNRKHEPKPIKMASTCHAMSEVSILIYFITFYAFFVFKCIKITYFF